MDEKVILQGTDGRLVALEVPEGVQSPSNGSSLNSYVIVAVPGLLDAQIDEHVRLWQPLGESAPKSWLSGLLPLYVHCTEITVFKYSIDEFPDGISISALDLLARKLLDALMARLHDSSKIIFLSHHLGGLIVKKALALARQVEDFYAVAGRTKALTFFETPHRVIHQGSWDSLANWLLVASGMNYRYSLSWISRTASTLKSVKDDFDAQKRWYQIINIYGMPLTNSAKTDQSRPNMLSSDESSWNFGISEEFNRSRDKPSNELCRFALDEDPDPDFKLICSTMGPSSARGDLFVRCIQTLASAAGSSQSQSNESSALGYQINAEGLAGLQENPSFTQWKNGSSGCIQLVVPFGDDSSLLFSKLKDPSTEGFLPVHSAVISYVFDPLSPDDNNESSMLSSLCYQLLCLKPGLFEHVLPVYSYYCPIASKAGWKPQMFYALLRSLISCPLDGETVCILREADGTILPKKLLSNFILSAGDHSQNFKLAIISNVEKSANEPIISIQGKKASLHSIVSHSLDCLTSRQPKLASVRQVMESRLLRLGQDQVHPNLLGGTLAEKMAGAEAWLVYLVDISSPVTKTSMNRCLDRMPTTRYKLFVEILNRVPLQSHRRVRRVLSWIAKSFRPLMIDEVAHISALDQPTRTIEDLLSNVPVDLEGELRGLLGSLAQIDGEGRCRLASSFQEFLLNGENDGSVWPSVRYCDGDLELARSCLGYISLFRDKRTASLASSNTTESVFLGYAVRQWTSHYLRGKLGRSGKEEPEMPDGFYPFFSDLSLMSLWANLYDSFLGRDRHGDDVHPLVVGAQLGCFDLVQVILHDKPKGQDESSLNEAILSRGLLAATTRGNQNVVDLLIKSGATAPYALHAAAMCGHHALVKKFKGAAASLAEEDADGMTPLHHACYNGDLEVVKELVPGSDINARSSKQGATPFHLACQLGHTEVVEYLLGIDGLLSNEADSDGLTSLHLACKFQQPGSVRALAEFAQKKDIKINVTDDQGETALLHAARGGRLDIIKILQGSLLVKDLGSSTSEVDDVWEDLLLQGNEHGQTALHLAAYGGHIETFKELLCPLDSGSPPGIFCSDVKGNLAIHLASKMGNLAVVRHLLGFSEDLSRSQITSAAFGERNAVPIHMAVENGHVEVVELLCEKHTKTKVSLDLFYGRQLSPLHISAGSGHLAIVKILLKAGATSNILDLDGASPLLLSCSGGHVAVAKHLLHARSDVNLRNDSGYSPLLYAVESGKEELVTLLLEHHADANIQGPRNLTPLLAAASKGDAKIVHLLHDFNAQWGAVDSDNQTALDLAVASNDEETVKCVLELSDRTYETADQHITALHRAAEQGRLSFIVLFLNDSRLKFDADAKDPRGYTAISYAARNNHLDVVKFLVEESPARATSIDGAGRTALSHAAEQGHIKIVEYLLGVNANTNTNPADIADNDRRSPLWHAVNNNREKVVRVLLQHCKVPNEGDSGDGHTPLHLAARDSYNDIVDALLAVPNINGNMKDDRDRSPIFLAAYAGNKTGVQKLIHARWFGNFPSQIYGWYPLHAAFDNSSILELFLAERDAVSDEGEAIIEKRDSDGSTVLHLAASNYPDSCKVLLKHGASLLLTDDNGETALHLAAKSGNEESIKSMLFNPDGSFRGYTKELDVKNKHRRTPLASALASGSLSTAKLLLSFDSVDFCSKDNDGSTLLHLAAENTNRDMVDLILKRITEVYGSDKRLACLNVRDDDNRLPLARAVASENAAIFELLLPDTDIDVNETDKDGKTLLDLTVEKGLDEFVETLFEKRGSSFSLECLIRVLHSAATRKYSLIEEQIVDLLKGSKEISLDENSEEQLFQVAAEMGDTLLIEFLQTLSGGRLTRRDKHGWTLDQIIQAREPKEEEQDGEHTEATEERSTSKVLDLPNQKLAPTESPHLPSLLDWFSFSPVEQEGQRVRMGDGNTPPWGVARANHPVPPQSKFYFGMRVIKLGDGDLGIGLCLGNYNGERLPGFEEDSWGFHGDNGAIYHGSTWSQARNEEWRFRPDDLVCCCVDTSLRIVTFTINGEPVEDARFKDIRGRVFPLVLIGPEAEVELKFGAEVGQDPFEDCGPRFVYDHNWLGPASDTDPDDRELMRAFYNYSEPFSCECRAFGRLQESGHEDLAIRCFGYVLLDEDHELAMMTQFSELDLDFNGDIDYPGAEDMRSRFLGRDGKAPPIRGIVKKFGYGDEKNLRPPLVCKIFRDIIKLQKLGIMRLDVTTRQIIDDRLSDFSTALTVPHFLTTPDLNPGLTPKMVSAIELKTFKLSISDYLGFDEMMSDWNLEYAAQNGRICVDAFPGRDGCRMRYNFRSKVAKERVYTFVDPRKYDWRRGTSAADGRQSRRSRPIS